MHHSRGETDRQSGRADREAEVLGVTVGVSDWVGGEPERLSVAVAEAVLMVWLGPVGAEPCRALHTVFTRPTCHFGDLKGGVRL